ncbi:MAG: C-terminal helicase domain-containing protein [Ilumatobacteraceae bacterium]
MATDVAARGIHVDGVASVVHYDPPEDHKTYIHRSGRTARAGASGLVVSLVQPDQRSDYRKIQRQVGLDEQVEDRRSADEPEVVSASVPTLAGVDKPKPRSNHGKNGQGGKNAKNGNRRRSNGHRGQGNRDEREPRHDGGRPDGGSRSGTGAGGRSERSDGQRHAASRAAAPRRTATATATAAGTGTTTATVRSAHADRAKRDIPGHIAVTRELPYPATARLTPRGVGQRSG